MSPSAARGGHLLAQRLAQATRRLMGAPFFSIVMPTRNRASLLSLAVRTAVMQSFDDFEIIVSDNHSEDGTQQAVAPFISSRVKYVRTPQVLAMPRAGSLRYRKRPASTSFFSPTTMRS
jgi:hypothetical protein